MNLGIRSRLIIAIILIIILPILLTFVGLGFSISKLESETTNEVNEIEKINSKLIREVVSSYKFINDREKFHQALTPLLNEYQLNVQIKNNHGQIIFDSLKNLAKANPNSTFLGNQYDYNIPIVIDEEVQGTLIVTPNPNTRPYNLYAKLTIYAALSIGAGLLSLVILLILFTWIITRSILRPIEELSKATEDVAQGNLNFAITYKTKDELGQFCQAFDLMRTKLKESLDRQAASELARKQLVSNISHDLATPISIIKGYVEGLEDGIARDEERYKRYIRVIKDKTEQLDRLIDDLSQYSKLELGHLEIKKELTDSRELFDNILNSFKVELERFSVDFRVRSPLPSIPIYVDRHRIEQVMDNLIGNANRYAGSDPYIEVQVKLTEDHNLLVSVKDNGIGISSEDMPHIFEIFYRGEKSRSREFGGSGQGLAICKFIIQEHGGRIWAESIRGKGSTFYFTLPYKEQGDFA